MEYFKLEALQIAGLILVQFLVLIVVVLQSNQTHDEDERNTVVDDFSCPQSIAYWAVIFVTNPFRIRLTFEQFMMNPRGYLQAHIFYPNNVDPEYFEPLLPAQVVVYERLLLAETIEENDLRLEELAERKLEHEYSELSISGGHFVSPMHKQRRTRKWKTRGFGAQLKPA